MSKQVNGVNDKKACEFTLIELLIVMAILAAMLLPVLPKAKEQAIRTQCMNNVRRATVVNSLPRCSDTQPGVRHYLATAVWACFGAGACLISVIARLP